MAKGVRFAKAEREWLKGWLEPLTRVDGKSAKLAQSVLDKLELAEMPVAKGTYLTVPDAISAFRGVLGTRLVAPGFQARGVLAQMKQRIQALGLTRADCVSIAKVAAAEWRGPVRAESLVRQADVLMAGAQGEFESTKHPHRDQSPVELGEEDI
jgi:hypothetical protein